MSHPERPRPTRMAEKKAPERPDRTKLRDEEKDATEELISANAKLVGADDWEGPQLYRANKDKWGICAGCEWFQYCETEFGYQWARCSETKMLLTQKDRMAECTMFEKIGTMSLRDMQQIAWYINPQKYRVGF